MKSFTSVPAEAVTIYNRALDLSNKGEIYPALDQYKQAISLHPRFLEAYNNIGELYSKLGQVDNAVNTYHQALSIERDYRVLLNLGVEYYNAGKYQTALSHFREAIEGHDDFLEGQFYSALTYHRMKDFSSAEHHLKKVIEIDPRHLKANYLLSSVYYEKKDYKSVIKCLDRIVDIADDKAFVNKYYGFCMYHLGRYEEAIGYLTSALELAPEYSRFRDYLKTLNYEDRRKEIGDIPAAIKVLEEKKKLDKMTLADYTRLSMLYIFEGESRKAEELLIPLKEKLKKAC